MSNSAQGLVIGSLFVPTVLLVPLATLVGVFGTLLYNRLFLSRKDRQDHNQQQFVNAKEMLADSVAKASDFTAAITKALKKTKPSVDDVQAIMKTGEVYFASLRTMAQAVLGGRVSDDTRRYEIVPKIAEALEKTLPAYYEALRIVSSKVGLPFDGKFNENNYESLFRVVDMYDHEAWIRARQMIAEGTLGS